MGARAVQQLLLLLALSLLLLSHCEGADSDTAPGIPTGEHPRGPSPPREARPRGGSFIFQPRARGWPGESGSPSLPRAADMSGGGLPLRAGTAEGSWAAVGGAGPGEVGSLALSNLSAQGFSAQVGISL